MPSETLAIPTIHGNAHDDARTQTTMRVRKRNGSTEPVDVNKIVRAVSRCCVGLRDVDAMRVATKTISGLYDGATTRELDQLSIQTAAALIVEEPQYARLAARLLATYIDKEVRNQEIHAFSQSIARGAPRWAWSTTASLSSSPPTRASSTTRSIAERDREFEYFGLRTVYDRYLLKHPQTRLVIETPQHFFLRIACALVGDGRRGARALPAVLVARVPARARRRCSTPARGTSSSRAASCSTRPTDQPREHLPALHRRRACSRSSRAASASPTHRVRSRGSLIESTNGHSNGIVPWLKTLDASVAAVNQGGKRKGACCVYLEPWHADIEEFLELRDNTGDEARRTHNLNLANWIPDLFMQRVEADGDWTLFDPKVVPAPARPLRRGVRARLRRGRGSRAWRAKTVKARELYARMMRTLAQTGNGWMTFKDKSQPRLQPDRAAGPNVVHLSNLCTEILEVTSQRRDGGLQPRLDQPRAAHRRPTDGDVRLRQARAHRAHRGAPARSRDRPQLSTRSTARSVEPALAPGRPRLMGLQDVFFQLRLPFDAPEARALSQRRSPRRSTSTRCRPRCELAREKGAHPAFAETRAARGELQFDAWGVDAGGHRRAGTRCASASQSTACATRC